MAPHPPLPSEMVDPPNTGAEKLLSPLAIADARALADRHNFLVLARHFGIPEDQRSRPDGDPR